MKENHWTTFAYAKINLALAVLGRRPDGYHELQTVMQSIDLHDTVRISFEGCGIECLCGNLSGPDNLAYQAAELFMSGLNMMNGIRIEGVRIEIEKKIPVQAGLAGGSSDAAATLRGLNDLLDRPYSDEELLQLANQLGSDVAFCLRGGTQWAEGRGEKLTILPTPPVMNIVLVKPEQGINTGESYRRFDAMGTGRPLDFQAWEKALLSGSLEAIIALFSNDLEQGSMDILPEIARIKDELIKVGCLGALMSGSGSAVFGIARSAKEAQTIAGHFKEKGYGVWVAKTKS